ncbi:MAG: tRNA 5-hydroxyuridine modification protein YegQ [Candidatus Marinimicrobia bacterium]|nr:tRNA 5-hydroxyuridine modification protein YegQ [Candidatus Neomarinimicrobiota bacterium]
MSSTPEILSPAGDMEKLKAALAFGADAVYAGIPKFSLRTRETGFTPENIASAIDYTHRLGKKIYLTLNIYPHNIKVDAFLRELDTVVPLGPDALIMADPGMIGLAHRRYPDMPVHLSTQANTVNWASVAFWRDLGVHRIILSRELRLEEIAEMHEKVPDIELEAFVHGAICIAYSGRCLISNYLHSRDANQGTCTNSCRWEYKLAYDRGSLLDVEREQRPYAYGTPPPEGFYVRESHRPDEAFPVGEDEHGTYLMNSRDLCAVELIPRLLDSGVVSLKIEGRTKSAYYTAITSRAYRRALDDHLAGRPFDPANLRDLMQLSNRTYTTGFYTRNPRQHGENFGDGYSAGTGAPVVGVVRDFDPASSLALIEVKNRFMPGDRLILITPERDIPLTVPEIRDTEGRKKDAAHGGAENVRIALPGNPGAFAFLRKAKPAEGGEGA